MPTTEDPDVPPQGPVFFPISFTDTVTVTSVESLSETISLPATDATQAISIQYYNQVDMTPVVTSTMPTASWDSDGIATFDIIIDYNFINDFGSNQGTLLVIVTSGNHSGAKSVPFNLPPI